ncbi:MAG: dienelactone hydrolase family protein, partial [Pseudomonadota bacterium]
MTLARGSIENSLEKLQMTNFKLKISALVTMGFVLLGCSEPFLSASTDDPGPNSNTVEDVDPEEPPAPPGQDFGVDLDGNSDEEFDDFQYKGTNVKYTPDMQGADKLIILLHGSGGGSENVEGRPEYTEFLAQAKAQGFFVVIPESTDRTTKQWFSGSVDVDENSDLKYISEVIDILLWNHMIAAGSQYFSLGHSNGGAFSSVLAYSLEFEAASIHGASGVDQLLEDEAYEVPTIFAMGDGDLEDRQQDARENHEVLRSRGVKTEFYINRNSGHEFSAQHTPAILSFFLGKNQGPTAATFVYASRGPEEKDEIDGVTIDADGFTYVSG